MKKNFFYFVIPSVIKGALGIFLIVPVTTYYLDPEDFGIAAILGMISGLVVPLSSTGVTWIVSAHYYKISKEERKQLLFNILFLDVALRVFWILFFWFIAKTTLPWIVIDYKPQHFLYFQLSLIAIMLNGIWPTISYFIVLQKKGKAHAILEVGQYLVGTITAIVCLALFKLTTVTLFIVPIVTGIFAFFASFLYMRHDILPKISRRWLMEIYKVGMPTIPSNLFALIVNTIDHYFIQRWITLSQLGIYAHSKNYQGIFTMGTKGFERTFVPVVLETFTRNHNPENLRRMLAIWYGLLGIGGLFVTLFSYEMIDVLTHGKFVASAPLVPIWFMLVFSYSLGMAYSQFIFLQKKTKFLVYSGISIGAVFIGVSALLIYNFGIMGAVTSAVLSNLTIQLSRRVYARKLGCNQIPEKEFITIVAFILGVYIVNVMFAFNFLERVFGFLLLSVLIMYHYGLIEIIKANTKIVFAHVTAWRARSS